MIKKNRASDKAIAQIQKQLLINKKQEEQLEAGHLNPEESEIR